MIDVELIRKLVDIVSHSDIDELKVGDKDIRVTIKKSTLEKGHIVYETKKETEEALKDKPQDYEKPKEEGIFITSPIVGTFYRSPSPGAPPFVDIDDEIRVGQTICIIEAMKLMNEVKSDYNGIVKEILVENGEPVEYGQPLFLIEPIEEVS
ncbi:MAG: acetyl-CoA carboxylase biotin carboxyl carrier protein [bacterium]